MSYCCCPLQLTPRLPVISYLLLATQFLYPPRTVDPLIIYKGYVDDPRNTDNAWMETVAVNFHDEQGDSLALFPLTAGKMMFAVSKLT
ncbi:unnamed protein product [Trichobilharzia regenti]|nr:unnamed protein product [Trichobilharzia regenti]